MAVFPQIPLTNQWTDGEELTAVKLNARIDQNLNALIPGFTSYTPTWTGVTLGNATNLGSYQFVGKVLSLNINLLSGSTTGTFGSLVTVSLPSGITAWTSLSSQYVYALISAGFAAVGTATISANGTTLGFYFPTASTTSGLTQFNSGSVSMPSGSRLVLTGNIVTN